MELINYQPHLHTFSFGCPLVCYMDLVTNILSFNILHIVMAKKESVDLNLIEIEERKELIKYTQYIIIV